MAVMAFVWRKFAGASHFPSRSCQIFPSRVPSHNDPSRSSANEMMLGFACSTNITSSAAVGGALSKLRQVARRHRQLPWLDFDTPLIWATPDCQPTLVSRLQLFPV